MIENVPLTKPEKPLGRFSESDAQREYVECMTSGLSFAASGHEGQWLYHDGRRILSLYPNGDRVSKPYTGLKWIEEAQKL